MQSPQFTLNKEDLKKWSKDSIIFFAPVLIMMLGDIQSGKSWEETIVAAKVWGLGMAINLLKKYVSS